MATKRSKPVVSDASRKRRAGDRLAAAGAGKTVPGLAGIDESALSPQAREALRRVVAENEAMRLQLEDAQGRIAQLERLADEDGLTAVANRRAFLRELSRMIAFSRRYGSPSSVVYFDVDGLKQLNDTHGHPAGDAALRHVAEILCKNVRSSDLVGRLGGDEFGVILAQTNQDQATGKAVALAQEIAKRSLRWGKVKLKVSAAYGVYSFSGSDDAHVAIEAADKAMYKQKRVASAR
jgi:diguanylate cyclase (GGDEF)-like protein